MNASKPSSVDVAVILFLLAYNHRPLTSLEMTPFDPRRRDRVIIFDGAFLKAAQGPYFHGGGVVGRGRRKRGREEEEEEGQGGGGGGGGTGAKEEGQGGGGGG